MLSKKFRLPVQDFPERSRSIFRGKIINGKLSDNDLGHFRVGVVVSRGVVRGAVARNNAKRKVFNFFSKEVNNMEGIGKDLLIILKSNKNASNEDSTELFGELGSLVKEIKK